jgi:hypothetical protein
MATSARAIGVTLLLVLAAATAACSRHGTPQPAALPAVTSTPPSAQPARSATTATSSAPTSSASSTGPDSTNTPATGTAANANYCSGSALQALFQANAANGSQRSGAVGLRNQSASVCTVSGYPDLQLLGRGDDPISTSVVKDAKSPAVVRLAPGQTAWAAMAWRTAAVADEPQSGPCQPAAGRLAVFLPGQTTQLSTSFDAGSVCDHGRITVSPLGAVG